MTSAAPAPRPLLQVRTIYAEPAALELERGQQVVARWPDAEVVQVPSASRVEGLHDDASNVDRWVRIKTEVLALGVRKTLTARRNERSANWIAPSTANGCAMACSYCYVPRHKGYANPITVYANIEQVVAYLQPPRRPAGCQAHRRPVRPRGVGVRHR